MSTQALAGHPCHPLGMWLRCYFPDPLDKAGGLVHTPLVSSTISPDVLVNSTGTPCRSPCLHEPVLFVLISSGSELDASCISSRTHAFCEYERCALSFLQLELAMLTLLGGTVLQMKKYWMQRYSSVFISTIKRQVKYIMMARWGTCLGLRSRGHHIPHEGWRWSC